MSTLNVVALHRPMTPRDPDEPHRVATPLELFFDLVFVVAIASAAEELHHGLSVAHFDALLGFLAVFFAIWWAWLNYSWFASAYECDDVVYRLLTFAIMAGSLILAAGVPDLFADGQSAAAVAGYAVMRLAMVALWLRAAAGDPARRSTALRYAVGIATVQVFWVLRLAVQDEAARMTTFIILILAELAVPYVAERAGSTPYHPHHIAERYSLFTIIVLGEVILAGVHAVQGVITRAPEGGGPGHTAGVSAAAGGLGAGLAVLVIGALLIVFALWWLYFKRDHSDLVAQGRATTWLFGYAHYVVFASVAAVGAALAAAVDVVQGGAGASPRAVAFALAVPISLYVLTLAALHTASDRSPGTFVPAVMVSVGVLALAAEAPSMPVGVVAIGLILAAAVAEHVVAGQRKARADRSASG